MDSRTELLVKQARVALRLTGPKMEVQHPLAARQCLRCTPPPKYQRCPVCDSEFDEAWKFQIHLKSASETCYREGQRKARIWANS